jgi:PIN domain
MKTAVDLLEAQRASLETLLRDFLLQHSALGERELPGAGIHVVGPNHSWATLDDRGRALQAKLLKEQSRFASLVNVLLRLAPEHSREDAAEASDVVRSMIEQSDVTWTSSTEEALDEALTALSIQVAAVKALYDPTPGQPVFVPDANAVVWNPDLEQWTFEGAARFSIVLTSTLLGELDDLKMPYRGESVRETAEGVIRRIKEYGRRGDIHAGVTLRRDRSTVRMTAAEPDFKNTLPWLDPTIKDDRLLAACLEIVREHPHSPVVLVTRDVNLQNKARLAGIQFVEPPDPPERATAEHPRRRRGPRPDVRIFDLKATGGSSGNVDFRALIQNYGTQPVRAIVTGAVNGEAVVCRPDTLNLLVNAEPSRVDIDVPRPELGDLVPPSTMRRRFMGKSSCSRLRSKRSAWRPRAGARRSTNPRAIGSVTKSNSERGVSDGAKRHPQISEPSISRSESASATNNRASRTNSGKLDGARRGSEYPPPRIDASHPPGPLLRYGRRLRSPSRSFRPWPEALKAPRCVRPCRGRRAASRRTEPRRASPPAAPRGSAAATARRRGEAGTVASRRSAPLVRALPRV